MCVGGGCLNVIIDMIDSCGNNTPDLQAFGLGALEDDDDEEVYHRDSMSRYDTVLGGEEPGDGLYGWTAPQQYTERRGQTRTVCMRTSRPEREADVCCRRIGREIQRQLVLGKDPGGLHSGPQTS